MGPPAKSSPGQPASTTANDRAAVAAQAVTARHLRRMCGLPGTRLAAVAWPMGTITGHFGSWHYWWQAHVVDLLVDAAIHRAPRDRAAAHVVEQLLRGIHLRNGFRWTNDYYDDMAWLALAVERADRHLNLRHPKALSTLCEQLIGSWVPHLGGGIPWRTTDYFFNAPANGPAAILLSRTGHLERAGDMVDWLDATLIDPTTGLVIDGVEPDAEPGRFRRVTAVYTYCQGVVLGAELELLRLTGDPVYADRIDRLLRAVASRMCDEGVLPGADGGDGGLFAGILTRYLALIVTDLPDTVAHADDLRRRAAEIVIASAEAAWAHRIDTDAGPVFGPDWRRPAHLPAGAGKQARSVGGAVHSSAIPERDLSVQLAAWMALEAAAAIELGLPEHDQTEPA